MATLPPSRPAQIQFCVTHAPVWELNQDAIGLPPGFAEDLAALTLAAQAAARAAHAARLASEVATQEYHLAVRAMRAKAAKGIRTIRTHADNTNDPEVLVLASLAPAKAASAAPLPTMPINVTATLDSGGAVVVSWESTGTHGAYFEIFRRFVGAPGASNGLSNSTQAAMVCIGGSGGKRFVDDGLPIGTSHAYYQVRAARGKKKGPLSLATAIQFGSVVVDAGEKAAGKGRAQGTARGRAA